MIGKTIAHYEVLDELGAGGMGVVYRALDTRLDREVAIKALPEGLSENPERLARFDREAKTLASLNHPNVGAIYGLEKAEDRQFLILELVEGETLEAELHRGPIPIDRALSIALQIAEALEAAHETGIIHRDLKPANIKITDSDRVKILDFGLAKALAAESPSLDLTQTPTLTQQMPGTGAILGTAAYMSPEQARGQTLDRRTDIWSFGCVLYECLAGNPSFLGATLSDTIAAVLDREPDWNALPEGVPSTVRRMLQRCLNKSASDRLRDIGDARIEIEEVLKEGPERWLAPPETASVPKTPSPMVTRRGIVMAALTVVAIIAGTVLWQLLPEERVVYLIDTAAPLGVYDPESRSSGRTNADDLSDVLGDLPITLVKEATSPWWRREHQVLMQRPALIVIHVSAFAYPTSTAEFEDLMSAQTEIERLGMEDPVELGRDRLIAFLGYIALGSPETRFVVYSRGHFREDSDRERWISGVETRFPELVDRIVAYDVPGEQGAQTFRDPATGEEVKLLVRSILSLD
jgi:serine/threonine protein kinase